MCALREFCDLEPRGCGGGSGGVGGGDGVCSVLKINIQYECGSKHLAHNSTLVDDAGAHGGALLRAACYHRRWVLRSLYSLSLSARWPQAAGERERNAIHRQLAAILHPSPICRRAFLLRRRVCRMNWKNMHVKWTTARSLARFYF